MFAVPHGLLRELRMVVGARADDHKLGLRVRKEFICSAVMFRIGIIHSAVLASLNTFLLSRRFGALQESINFQVGVRSDEWQVKAFGGEAIAHEANLDWCHDFRNVGSLD